MPTIPRQHHLNLPRHRYLSSHQVSMFTDMVNERFALDDEEGRAPFRQAWRDIDSRDAFTDVVRQLRAIPTLAQRHYEAGRETRLATVTALLPTTQDRIEREQRVTEPGYYRNPADGTLYRVSQTKEGLRVATYSKTGGPRRLTVEGNLVKGTWKRHAGFASRQLFARTLRRDWQISELALVEFAYGFCPLHGGPLSDGVSVALGRGPKCSAREGLEWSEEAARKVLVGQGIDADAFLAKHAGKAEG